MNNDHFQAVMQKWLKLELEKIPELKPSEAMYELLQKNARKERSNYTHTSWYFAAAALLLVAFFSVANYERIFYPAPPAVAELETRQDVEDKDDISFESTFKAHRKMGVPEAVEKEGIPDIITFHFQREGSFFATEVDMKEPLEYPIGLTSADNYRISVSPSAGSYLYVFQLNSEGDLMKIFPDEEKSMTNPLQTSQKYMLPGPDEWYHLDNRTGEEKIYLCLRQEKDDQLLQMYQKYINTRSVGRRANRRDQIIKQLEELNSRIMLLKNQ